MDEIFIGYYNLCWNCNTIIDRTNFYGSEKCKHECESRQKPGKTISEPLGKEISVEDMQKIVDANEKLVKDLENK